MYYIMFCVLQLSVIKKKLENNYKICRIFPALIKVLTLNVLALPTLSRIKL